MSSTTRHRACTAVANAAERSPRPLPVYAKREDTVRTTHTSTSWRRVLPPAATSHARYQYLLPPPLTWSLTVSARKYLSLSACCGDVNSGATRGSPSSSVTRLPCSATTCRQQASA